MACCNSNENSCNQKCGSSNINYVILLVLYILLAIILGTTLCY